MTQVGTDKQIAAQLAASLGSEDGKDDSYVQQLYCFHDRSFERFLVNKNPAFSEYPIGATSVEADSNYPYLTGGSRDCEIHTNDARSSIFDTTCTWQIEIDGGDDTPFTLHMSKSDAVKINTKVTVRLQGTLETRYQVPSTLSSALREMFQLKDDDLNSDSCIAWTIRFEDKSIDNDSTDANVKSTINSIFTNFFGQNELSSLLIPIAFLTPDELKMRTKPGDNSAFASKLGLAIAPSQDVETTNPDKSNSIYVVLQHHPSSGIINRSGPSAPYVQQWRIPCSPIDNAMVLSKQDVFQSILNGLQQDPDPSMMDAVVKEVLSLISHEDPFAQRSWSGWSFDTAKGDFNWISGPDDSNGSHAKQCAEGQAIAAANGCAYDGDRSDEPHHEWTFGLQRRVANRLYFTPGYADSHGKDYGPRLPMQNGDSTQSNTSNKWSTCLIGKTNFEAGNAIGGNMFSNATYEVFWRVYFNFTGFFEDKSTVGVSDVVFKTHVEGEAGHANYLSDQFTDQDDRLKRWIVASDFKKTVEQFVRSKLLLHYDGGD